MIFASKPSKNHAAMRATVALAIASLGMVSLALADSSAPVNTPASTTASAASQENFPIYKDEDGHLIPPGPTQKEIDMGKKAAESIAKDPKVKIVPQDKDEKTKALYAKLNAMAEKIGKASVRPGIQYKVTIIEDNTLNAFTLPNGSVYFYTGLLDVLGSDDEIAAVMAHEIGHNARMHALRGDKKAQKVSLIGLAAMLAALAGGQNGANLAAFSQYAMVGVMSGYSIKLEKEADTAGVSEMIKAGYNPSAMATVMQRFAAEEKRHPELYGGILIDHPEPTERIAAVKTQMEKAGVPFNPRAVSGAPQATVVKGTDRVSIQYRGATLMQFANVPSPEAAVKRADAAAATLNQLIHEDIQSHQIKIMETSAPPKGSVMLTGLDMDIAQVTPDDAALANTTPFECAKKWKSNLGSVFMIEAVNGGG